MNVCSIDLQVVLQSDELSLHFLQKLPATVGRSPFVDDLAIWYGAPSVRHMGRQLQLAVTRLQKWSHESGLRFSTAKTKW